MQESAVQAKTLDELRAEIRRLGVDLAVADDLAVLGQPVAIADRRAPNRFCVQPMEGGDAGADGSPGPLTVRRYRRYAEGGFGLIWVEATAVLAAARSQPTQLHLHRDNVAAFRGLVAAMRGAARQRFGHDVVIVLQLAHAGRSSRSEGEARPVLVHRHPALDAVQRISGDTPLVTDDALDRLQESYVEAARFAAQAGFDGVDVKSCHRDLVAELLAAVTRDGRYGGDFANRSRFLLDAVARIRQDVPGLFVATRLSAVGAAPYPHGFGVSRDDWRTPDLSEPLRLVKRLQQTGLSILNVSVDRAAVAEGVQGEGPLMEMGRQANLTARLQRAVPGIPVIVGGWSRLGRFLPHVAAGEIGRGGAAMVGMGRSALASPDAPAEILSSGRMDPAKGCLFCGACGELLKSGGGAGCVIRDAETYAAEYRHRRRFASDHLKREAQRCRGCEAAPCAAGCPARIDIPAFIRAYAEDDIAAAYAAIRESNCLPEMCSHLCPTWLLCEGPCVENTLTGTPIPIHDIQYAVCWRARLQGLVGVRLPEARSGRTLAVVGGGPAGLAGAVVLLERGHDVDLFEQADQLGGTPERVIPERRYLGAKAEIAALLEPAVESGRLRVRLGKRLGRDIALESLRDSHDAVLLTLGVWGERPLAPGGTRPSGVVDALAFLGAIKRGDAVRVPEQVAVLGGGDSAMDAAVAAMKLGARELTVVYAGTLADMHWHMPDGWFRASGAHSMTLTQPLGYESDAQGRLAGLRICRTEPGFPDAEGTRRPVAVPGTESTLRVAMAIEAMGLEVGADVKALKGLTITERGLARLAPDGSFLAGAPNVFAAGGMVNGGASVVQCVAEGMKAAAEIDRFVRA